MIYLCIFQFDSLNKNKNWFFFLGYWFLFFVNKKKLVFQAYAATQPKMFLVKICLPDV